MRLYPTFKLKDIIKLQLCPLIKNRFITNDRFKGDGVVIVIIDVV